MGTHLLDRGDVYLRDEDYLLDKFTKLDLSCSSCSEDFHEDDEVVLVNIVTAQRHPNGQIHCFDVLDDEGDYCFEPHILHFECWEDICTEHAENIRDTPPIWDDDHIKLIDCEFCRDGIRAYERFAFVLYGEMKRSNRISNGSTQPVFVPMDKADTQNVCLGCLGRIADECLELWGEVAQHNECHTCAHLRCWRPDLRQCQCECHQEIE